MKVFFFLSDNLPSTQSRHMGDAQCTHSDRHLAPGQVSKQTIQQFSLSQSDLEQHIAWSFQGYSLEFLTLAAAIN